MAREITYSDNTAGNFRLNVFATGSYMCTCRKCGLQYIGDKRSMRCLKCAIEATEEKITSNNTASTKFTEEIMNRLEAVLVIISTKCSDEEIQCAYEELDDCISKLRA